MIEARGLTMKYGSFLAVEGVSFAVPEGKIMGLLGPNGAGKTTILKMLATQLVPTSGTARIAGFDVVSSPGKVRENLGFLPENTPLYENMEVGEYLGFVAEARLPDKAFARRQLEWVAESFNLARVWFSPISQLSKGYRQRVGLAQAVMHDPPCLILDEPTSGLDPLQILEMRNFIKELARKKAIVFSTHILPEVEAISDFVCIISQGKQVALGEISQLKKLVSQEIVWRLKVNKRLNSLAGISGLTIKHEKKEKEGFSYLLSAKNPLEERIVKAICHEEATILFFGRESETLEHIFLELVARKAKEGEHESL
ncbi:ABC transporter ATP-binding protein [Thermodesulfatator atlanticus]|uniref:ABC transporter ATP-binding protein n=1 Tax=Thermodesulfatator atlanticus TaxID=501497 RepID=UPI0003B6BBBF|nr:ABC transporter ATP-binding protein [Thermodesulfatator atlanticus]